MPICPPGTIPNRYSRPITAPASMPNRSLARSPKSPSPSGRVKRCVTRKALLYFGSRSAVGRLINVKSGSSSLSASSSGACAKEADAHSSITDRASEIRIVDKRVTEAPIDLVARCTDGDPAFQDEHLSIGEKRPGSKRHPHADDAGPSFEFVHQIAVLGITGDDSDHAGLPSARHVDELIVSEVVHQIQPAGRVAANVRMAVGPRQAPGRIGGFEDLTLHARKRRLEIRRGTGELRELFITGRRR